MLFKMPKNLGEKYSPLYFLASVGSGGMVVTFFMYLLFWVPHKGRTVPNFEDISAFVATAGGLGQAMVAIALIGIATFAFLNIRLLVWNINEYAKFKKTDAFKAHQKSNAQSQVMAIPLAYAMSINAMFILGLAFVPKLWSVIEYLFPLAMIGFILVGIYAFKLLAQFLGRIMVQGGFNNAANNSFTQMLPAFAFAMVGVGFSAPSAMSSEPLIVGLGLVFSTFFFVTAAIISLIALFLGMQSIMENGVAPEGAPTLLIIVPMMTVLGILTLRQDHGLHTQFDVHSAPAQTLMLLATFLSIQLVFTLFGVMVLRRQNYAQNFLNSGAGSPGSYALICPGIALSVMGHFFINKGLVATGMVDKYSIIYWALSLLAVGAQVSMIWLLVKVNTQHFGRARRSALLAAE